MALPSESLVILSPVGVDGATANSLGVINLQTTGNKCLFFVPVKMTLERFQLSIPVGESDAGGAANVSLFSVSAANAQTLITALVVPASNSVGNTIYKIPANVTILNAGTVLAINVITEGVSNLNCIPRLIGTYCSEVEGNQSLLVASA